MATRQIKDAKDLSTNELIYFKGHAQATFMSDGRTVEEAINSASGNIDTSNFPQYDYQEAITTQGINNGNGATYAIPGSDIADGGEYDDTFALKSDIPNTDEFVKFDNSPTKQITLDALQGDEYGSYLYLDRYGIEFYTGDGNGSIYINNLGDGTKFLSDDGSYKTISSGATDLSQKQDTLVSGTNIKTINSTSLLGSGNIAITDTKNLTYSLNNSTSGTVTLLPNVCIYMPNPLTGKLAINACATISSNNADLIESRICFRMPDNAALPAIQFNGVAIRWAGGNAPTFEADFTYEVSLFYPSNANSVGPMGVCVGFK